MERHIVVSIICLMLLAPATSFADKVYVTDRFQIPLRASQTSDAPVVETLVSGAPLDTLQQVGNVVQVRAADGSEGWVDANAITHSMPARMQLDALRAQQASLQANLAKAQASQVSLQAKLAKAQDSLAKETSKATQLADKLRTMVTAPTPPQATAPVQTQATPPAPPPSPAIAPPSDGGESPYVVAAWLGLSFAMLVIGFFAGMTWLRETNRRKLGGMYLRI